MTKHLQGVGEVDAIIAKDLKKNDIMIWNFGYTSTLKNIVRETLKTITIETICNSTGQKGERRLNKKRLVGIQL